MSIVPRPLLVILLVGAVLRLVVLWRFAGVPLAVVDERDYDQLATAIVERGEYGFSPGHLTSLRPPLYSVMVAGVYKVFGLHNHQAVRAVQIALSLATTCLVYFLAQGLYDERTARIAAAVHSVYPSLIGAGALVLTETLFTLLVCCFLALVVSYLKRPSRSTLAVAGAVLGLAALTRSVLWLFPPLFAVFIIFFGSDRTWRGRMISAATLIVTFAATLAPWTIRNTRLQQTFTTVDVMGGRNVMMGNYEFTPFTRPWAAIDIEGDRAWIQVLSRAHGGLAGKTQGQIDKLAMKYAIGYVLAHPGQTFVRSSAKLFHFWQLERELIAGAQHEIWGPFNLLAIVLMAAAILGCYAATLICGVFGVFLAPPQNVAAHGFLLLLVAFVTALHCLAFAHSRYHLPLMPVVMIYAAAAWVQRASILSSWRTWKFAVAAVICLLLITSWIWDVAYEMGRL